MNTYYVDLTNCKDKETFHNAVVRDLPVPDYYGHNLDALYDVLTAMGPCEIVLTHAESLEENDPDYYERVLQVLTDATEENDGLDVEIQSLASEVPLVMYDEEDEDEDDDFYINAFTAFSRDWAILTAGDQDKWNGMLIGWGQVGTLWGEPVCTVYVRKSRYTHEIMEDSDIFTVSFFDHDEYKKDLAVMGRLSGRDGDKVARTSLTPIPLDKGVTYDEANLTLVCEKIYTQTLDYEAMAPVGQAQYKDGDMHDMYIGKVIEIIEG